MKRVAPRFWAHDEEDVVRHLYPTGGAEAVHDVLPHRTLGAIRNRASIIGVPPRNPSIMTWNSETIDRIVSMISREPRPTNAEIAAELGCSVTALATLLSRRGISNSHGAEAPARYPPREADAAVHLLPRAVSAGVARQSALPPLQRGNLGNGGLRIQ